MKLVKNLRHCLKNSRQGCEALSTQDVQHMFDVYLNVSLSCLSFLYYLSQLILSYPPHLVILRLQLKQKTHDGRLHVTQLFGISFSILFSLQIIFHQFKLVICFKNLLKNICSIQEILCIQLKQKMHHDRLHVIQLFGITFSVLFSLQMFLHQIQVHDLI